MRETKLKVPAMRCGSCVHHVERTLEAVEGVAGVEVRLREGRAIVRHAEGVCTGTLLEALAEAGYDAGVETC